MLVVGGRVRLFPIKFFLIRTLDRRSSLIIVRGIFFFFEILIPSAFIIFLLSTIFYFVYRLCSFAFVVYLYDDWRLFISFFFWKLFTSLAGIESDFHKKKRYITIISDQHVNPTGIGKKNPKKFVRTNFFFQGPARNWT